MNPALGFRAWAFKPRGTSVDSGRRDLLHFHLDREVMYVVHKFTKKIIFHLFQQSIFLDDYFSFFFNQVASANPGTRLREINEKLLLKKNWFQNMIIIKNILARILKSNDNKLRINLRE